METIMLARKKAGLTQQQLAEAIGVKRAVISKYENGAIEPSIAQIQKIAEALDTSAAFLIGIVSSPDEKSLNADAVDLAISEYVQEENSLIADIEKNRNYRLTAIQKAKNLHLDAVMKICTDPHLLDAAQQAHELELMPQRIAMVTDFVERNADFLRKNMPGMLSDGEEDEK